MFALSYYYGFLFQGYLLYVCWIYFCLWYALQFLSNSFWFFISIHLLSLYLSFQSLLLSCAFSTLSSPVLFQIYPSYLCCFYFFCCNIWLSPGSLQCISCSYLTNLTLTPCISALHNCFKKVIAIHYILKLHGEMFGHNFPLLLWQYVFSMWFFMYNWFSLFLSCSIFI